VGRLFQNADTSTQIVDRHAPMSTGKPRMPPELCKGSGNRCKKRPDFLRMRPGMRNSSVHMRGMLPKVLNLSGRLPKEWTDSARCQPTCRKIDPRFFACVPTNDACGPMSGACGSTICDSDPTFCECRSRFCEHRPEICAIDRACVQDEVAIGVGQEGIRRVASTSVKTGHGSVASWKTRAGPHLCPADSTSIWPVIPGFRGGRLCGRAGRQRLHQARVAIHANVGLHDRRIHGACRA
jgi:hypothetical protein